MHTKPIQLILVALLCLFSQSYLRAQCLTPPPLDSCYGSEPSATNNETLNDGVKKWYYGTTATFTSLTLRGGTLVVCSDLTVDQFYMDSGTIIIRPGARFVIGNGIGFGLDLKGKSAIYNWGTFQCMRNLSLSGNWAGPARPNIIMNVLPTSKFHMQNQYFVMNNPYSFFVNNGFSEFHGIITDPLAAPGSVCLGKSSETMMTVLYNKSKFSYTAPSGAACLNVSEYSNFYDTLTNSNNINVCLGPKHYSDSSCRPWGCKPNAWGQANLFKKCNMCTDIHLLTLQITDFNIQTKGSSYQLTWKTNLPVNEEYIFTIERSSDGRYFSAIDSITIAKQNRLSIFAIIDKNPLNGYAYYRVQCKSRFANVSVSSPIQKVFFELGAVTRVYPNPFKNGFTVNILPGKKPRKIEFFTLKGVLVMSVPVRASDGHNIYINFPAKAEQGAYFMKVYYEHDTEIKKIFKED